MNAANISKKNSNNKRKKKINLKIIKKKKKKKKKNKIHEFKRTTKWFYKPSRLSTITHTKDISIWSEFFPPLPFCTSITKMVMGFRTTNSSWFACAKMAFLYNKSFKGHLALNESLQKKTVVYSLANWGVLLILYATVYVNNRWRKVTFNQLVLLKLFSPSN